MFPQALVRLLARTRSGWARGRTLPRPVVAVALVLATSVSPLAAQPLQAAAQWQASVGAQSEDAAIQALAFLPNELTVNVGDSITWSFRTAEIHTLTLLTGHSRPPFQTAPTTPNNAVYDPTNAAHDYINSGPFTAGQGYTVSFGAPSTCTSGPCYTASFVCLVHRQMTGTVHVNAAGAAYPNPQSAYDRQARDAAQTLLGQGRQLRAEEMADTVQGPGHDQVTVGKGFVAPTIAGASSVMIARFLPQNLEIPVGGAVHWTALDPATPHTITFGAEPPDPTTPVGLDSTGHGATITSPGQAVNSGFLGAPTVPPFVGNRFTVTFTAPGRYDYICALHDTFGMKGTIIVRPTGAGSGDH